MRIEKNRIFVATIGEDYREVTKKYGFGTELDQFSFSQNMDSEEEIKAVWEEIASKKASSPFILHGPFTEIFPAAIDPKAREFSKSRLMQAYELAEKFAIDKMVVHSGYAPFTYFKCWQVERSIEFWCEFLGRIAVRRKEKGLGRFVLTVENVLDDEPDMLADIIKGVRESLEKESTDKASDFARIGACLDIGHANCVGDLPLEVWVQRLSPYLMHTHIHDNYGQRGKDLHLPPGEGSIEVKTLIEHIEKLTSDGRCDCEKVTYTMECSDCSSAADWFDKNFCQI